MCCSSINSNSERTAGHKRPREATQEGAASPGGGPAQTSSDLQGKLSGLHDRVMQLEMQLKEKEMEAARVRQLLALKAGELVRKR
jgi:hypothetical protein